MSKQVDNSNPERKIFLRNKFIEKSDSVLDLFCGNGIIYKSCYSENKYFGVDKNKVHNNSICVISDNKQFIRSNDVSEYDIFDLDDYGCPYFIMTMILKKLSPINKTYKFFITDGSILHYNLSGKFDGIIQKSEKLTAKSKIKFAGRFTIDVFLSFLNKSSISLSFVLTNIYYIFNSKHSVCYMYFSISPEPKGRHE